VRGPEALLGGIPTDPDCASAWLVLADWLEEYDDPRRAELLRLHQQSLAGCSDPDRHPGRPAQQARLLELLGAGVRPCVPSRPSCWTRGWR